MPRFNPLKPSKVAASKARPEPLPRGTIPSPKPVSATPTLTENEEKDGFELRFPGKPTPQVLEMFHSTKELPSENRWRYHFTGKFWYAKRNDITRALVQAIMASTPAAPVAPAPTPPSNIVTVAFTPPAPVAVPVTTPPPTMASSWRNRFRR